MIKSSCTCSSLISVYVTYGSRIRVESAIDTCIKVGCLHYTFWGAAAFLWTLLECTMLYAPGCPLFCATVVYTKGLLKNVFVLLYWIFWRIHKVFLSYDLNATGYIWFSICFGMSTGSNSVLKIYLLQNVFLCWLIIGMFWVVNRLYYQYIPEGKEFPVLCRKLAAESKGWMKSVSNYVIGVSKKEQVLLDWNEIAERYGISFSYYSFNKPLFALLVSLASTCYINFASLCIFVHSFHFLPIDFFVFSFCEIGRYSMIPRCQRSYSNTLAKRKRKLLY